MKKEGLIFIGIGVISGLYALTCAYTFGKHAAFRWMKKEIEKECDKRTNEIKEES